MKIFVRDTKQELIDELNKQYKNPPERPWEFKDVDFVMGDIFGVKVDAFVSPANSFGWMDGGIDLYFVEQIGWDLQDKAMNAAKEQPFKEMLIGSAVLIHTHAEKWPLMIMAPTMRTPRKIGHEAVFLATRAAMRVAYKYSLDSVVFPGMGTGTGDVPLDQAAGAMLTGMQNATQHHLANDVMGRLV